MLTITLALSCLALGTVSPETPKTRDTQRPPDPALTIQIGEPAPELSIEEWRQLPEGVEPPTLETLRGNFVIIEYWGPFCAPCIAAFPHFNDLIEELKDEPVVFISVGDQRYNPGCKRILDRRPLNSWLAFDHDLSYFKAFGVHALPRTIVVDPQGNVAAYTSPKHVTAEVLRAALEGEPIESHYKPGEFKKEEKPAEG